MDATIDTILARCDWLELQLERLKGLSYLRDAERIGATLADIRVSLLTMGDDTVGFGGDTMLTMLGIRATCTAGAPGIYRNWIRKARDAVRKPAPGEPIRVERDTMRELRAAVRDLIDEIDPDGFANVRITKERSKRVAYVTASTWGEEQ